MFEHFTFGAQAQPVYHQQDDVAASPTDTSFPSPLAFEESDLTMAIESCLPQQEGMGDIVHKFSQQSLELEANQKPAVLPEVLPDGLLEVSPLEVPESRPQSVPELVPEASTSAENTRDPRDFDQDISEFTIEELSYVSTTRGMKTVVYDIFASGIPSTLPLLSHPRNGKVACRRVNRQVDTSRACQSQTRGDISTLVENMIDSNSQCNLHTTLSKSQQSSPTLSKAGDEDSMMDVPEGMEFPIEVDDDDGFGELDSEMQHMEEELMSLRRAGTPNGIRKYIPIRYRKSGEGSTVGGFTATGRPKVRNVPRMRRRPKVKAPPPE